MVTEVSRAFGGPALAEGERNGKTVERWKGETSRCGPTNLVCYGGIGFLVDPSILNALQRAMYMKGADGAVYLAQADHSDSPTQERTLARTRPNGGCIWRMWQRWYVCHNCRRFFLGTESLPETVFETDDDEQFEYAKNLITQDPEARKRLERVTVRD